MNNTYRTIALAAALGALSGMRSMLPAAVLTRALRSTDRGRGPASTALGGPIPALLLPVLSGGELIADKTPLVPNRTDPFPLIGRAGMSMLCAVAIAENRGERIILPAAVAGTTAIFGAFLGYHVRRLLTKRAGIPDPIVAIAEDAFVLASSRSVVGRALSG